MAHIEMCIFLYIFGNIYYTNKSLRIG